VPSIVLLVSSTIFRSDVEWKPPAADERANAVGCYAVVVGAAGITLGYLLLCLLVFGSRSDPFGATTLMALAAIGLGLAILAVTAVIGLGWRLWRADWRSAALMAAALVAAGALGLVTVGWVAALVSRSEWLLPATTTLAAIAAAPAVGRGARTIVVVAVLAVILSGGLFGWGIASRLDVRVVNDPSPMRAADARAYLLFEASESGTFEIRAGDGGCLYGRRIASGTYGPGWEETDGVDTTGKVPLGDTGLVEGSNVVFVCLRHGIASGEARQTVVVDDTPPAAATLDIQPTTGDSDHRTATTRDLTFSGTASGGRVSLEINGMAAREVDAIDGRWSIEWPLSLATDQAAFGAVVVDGAGNVTRSNMIHVRILGDPPPVALVDHPGLAVECRGEPRLSGDACRTWAVDTLDLHPEFLAEATRFVLALRDRLGACYAESRGADGFTRIGIVIPCPGS
jgi:hypothetical protein